VIRLFSIQCPIREILNTPGQATTVSFRGEAREGGNFQKKKSLEKDNKKKKSGGKKLNSFYLRNRE
jgi:hypothetical protein